MIALIHAPIVTYFSYPVSHLLGALYFTAQKKEEPTG